MNFGKTTEDLPGVYLLAGLAFDLRDHIQAKMHAQMQMKMSMRLSPWSWWP